MKHSGFSKINWGMEMRNMKKDESDRQDLETYRKEIDGIDQQVISLLSRRQDVAALIGDIKRDIGTQIFDPGREETILGRLSTKRSKNLSEKAIRDIFREIISAAYSVQEPLTVAFLGPEATFTHQAALSVFGHGALFSGVETIEDVFGLVEKGVCGNGVVPVENSYEGSVNSTLDFLHQYDLRIQAEVFLRIRHHLLGKATDIREIKRLFSHPMPVKQCRSWIRENMTGIPIKEVQSTSFAAKMAAEDMEAGVIGSDLLASEYGLNILAENIEDHPDNVTRFLCIGKESVAPTGRDKTSILFSLKHRPGSLYNALEALERKKINMTRIESRPMKLRNWEYLFFVDLEGHEQEININRAIREMEKRCIFLKRLGSYPVGKK
jgi:chorismate mutase/prephenate dehydratase